MKIPEWKRLQMLRYRKILCDSVIYYGPLVFFSFLFDVQEQLSEVKAKRKKKVVVVSSARKSPRVRPTSNDREESRLAGNQQIGKKLKKDMKQMKKKRRRAGEFNSTSWLFFVIGTILIGFLFLDALGDKLSDALEGALSGLTSKSGDNYDFNEHFS